MCAVLMLFIDMTLENNLHKKNDFSFYNVFLEHFRIYLRILEIFAQKIPHLLSKGPTWADLYFVCLPYSEPSLPF